MRHTLLFLALFLPASLLAQDFKVDFQEYDLDNGLHVILHEDHSAPVVTTAIMYKVGSKNEDPDVTGTAHFVEHLMFEGTENIGQDGFAQYAQKAGGQLNANTSWDRTYYYEKLPSNQLEMGLWLESERLMHAVVADRKAGVEEQREVVIEERKQRVENRPYGDIAIQMKKRLYKNHPYKHPLIGYMEDLENATQKDLNAIYDKYYVPNNAVLVVAGDIDPDSTKEMVQDYFGPIQAGDEVEGLDVEEPDMLNGEIRDTVYDQIQLPAVVQGYKTPGTGTKDYYAMDMLFRVLSRGESSRMSQKIQQEKELALAVNAVPFPTYDDPGMSLSFAIANSNADPGKLEKAMEKEYKKVRKELITKDEFEKVRNQIESEFVDRNSSITGKAQNLATYHLLRGDTDLINEEIDKYMDVTRKDIKRVANKYLIKSNRVTLYYLPKSAK